MLDDRLECRSVPAIKQYEIRVRQSVIDLKIVRLLDLARFMIKKVLRGIFADAVSLLGVTAWWLRSSACLAEVN